MNGTLPLYEYRFSGGDTLRWWGHSNITLCKIICLNLLHSQAAGMQKRVQTVAPRRERSCLSYLMEFPWPNFFSLIFAYIFLHFTR